jgi:hypothetical protein
MAKLKVSPNSFEAEANLGVVGDIAIKRLPQIIYNWWTNRKNIKIIEKTINDIRNLAFKPWKKYIKYFRLYQNFSLPKNEEQVKAQSKYDIEHLQEPRHFEEFENRLDKEYAHFDIIKKFQDENGGQDNFGVYLERAIKLHGYKMLPFRKVYTYSKKGKAVCILEEFRPFDNSYNIFVYCTKNHETK